MSAPKRKIGKAEAIAKITFVNTMWGFSFIASKYAMQQGFGEFSLAFVRYIFVCLVMLPLLRIREGRLRLPERKDWPAIFLSGMFGISLYFAFEYLGVRRTTVANASLVLSAIPVLSILLAAARGRRYTPACWLGVLLSMAGVALVVYAGVSEQGGGVNTEVLLGNLLLLGACVSWVAYVEVSSGLLKRHAHLNLTVWQGVSGLIALAPMALIEGIGGKWQPVPIGGWLAALFLALICSALCFFYYVQAISALSPVQTSIFINLNPIVAVLAGAALLGEPFGLTQAAGGLLIVASILLVNRGMRARWA